MCHEAQEICAPHAVNTIKSEQIKWRKSMVFSELERIICERVIKQKKCNTIETKGSFINLNILYQPKHLSLFKVVSTCQAYNL